MALPAQTERSCEQGCTGLRPDYSQLDGSRNFTRKYIIKIRTNKMNSKGLTTSSIGIAFLFLASLAFGCQFALFFGMVTIVSSFCVFSKIEADQNVYDVGFWFTRIPGRRLLAWFRAFGKVEAVVRSLLLGLLAWFTFAGLDRVRILDSTVRLCMAVLLSYIFLSYLVKNAHLNVLRWAYMKLSMILGIAFSTLSVIMRTPRRSFVTAIWDSIKGNWTGGNELSLNQAVEQIHVVTNDAIELIHEKLDGIVGEPVASIVMILLNSQVLMGFLVVLYTFLLLLLTIPELRRRPEDQPSQSPQGSPSSAPQ